MVIQHLIVPLEAQYSESFFRGGRADGGRLVLKKGETLSTDTYFNSFSYTVYRDFTDVSAVSAEVKFSGNIRLELCLYDGSESVLAERTASSGSPAGISAQRGVIRTSGRSVPVFQSVRAERQRDIQRRIQLGRSSAGRH